MAQQAWTGKTGGTHRMQRMLVGLIRNTDIRVAYSAMHLWLIWYILFRAKERHGAYVFHRRRGRKPLQAAVDVYRSFYHFGQAIIDRFAVYAGEHFDVTVENRELYYGRVHDKDGFIMLFSHVGNTEIAGYFLTTPDKRMHILAYGGESPVVTAHRQEVLSRNNIGMITVQPGDMSHIYRISEVLQRGDVLGMAADRCMGDNTVRCPILGAEAALPAGPFRICQAMKETVLLVFVLKQGPRSYRVQVEELQPDKTLAQQYAQRLEQMALSHPYEWFNFYDFWH
ncbi:MAG: hypothetical protein II140_00125 [Paludibacteraceae bacterium]|nr:hypothetical protein [Paludibacteraceae bacterium]